MNQRFNQGLICILENGVLTNDCDSDFTLWVKQRMNDGFPTRQIRSWSTCDAKRIQNLLIQTFFMVGQRHFVDALCIVCRDNSFLANVTELGQLATLILRDLAITANHENVWLNTDGAQLFYRVLGWLGFHFTSTCNVRQQCQVDVNSLSAWQIVAKLTDSFKEWQTFNITNGTADLAEYEIIAFITVQNEVLDRVSHMRNHLHGTTQVITTAFFRDNVLINATSGNVILLVCRTASETLVVTKVQVSFSAIVGHITLTMLVRAHGTWINVQIRVELTKSHLVSARL